jgi:hypothetical protein
MRKLAIIIFTFAFGALSVGYGQSGKADFTGEWQLDKAKSKGLPEGIDQVLTVAQKGDRLDVKTRVSGGPNGEQTHEDSYSLTGEAADFKPPMISGGGTVKKAKRTAKWAAEGKGMDATEQADIEGPNGPATIKATRSWRLSEDGKTLTVEMAIDQPDGDTNKSTRIFTKK